jgi:WD40 repeat protein
MLIKDMMRSLLVLSILVILLAGCGSGELPPTEAQTAEEAVSTLATVTPSSAPLPSYTPSPSPALQPSKTRTITSTATVTPTPSPSITPMAESQVTAHPLALDAYGAAMQFKQLARFGQGTLYDIDWSQDGKYLAASTGLGVYLYDGVTFEQVHFIDVNDGVTHVDFCPDGNTLAVAQGTHISVWDIPSGQKTIDMAGGIRGGIWKLVCGQGGYIAAVGQIARGLGESVPQVKVWWVPTGQLLYSDGQIVGWTYAVDINPDGKTIAFLGKDGMALRDIRTGKIIQEITGHVDAVFSSDGMKLFTSIWDWYDTGEEFIIRVLNPMSGEGQQILNGAKCQYLSLNGSGAICFGQENVIQFDPSDGTTLNVFSFDKEIDHAVIGPDARSLAVIEGDTVIVLDTQTGQEVKTISFEPFERMAASLIRLDETDHYAAAISNQTGLVQIIDLVSGAILRKVQMSESGINGMVFSPDRTTLASIDGGSIFRLWNFQDGTVTHQFYPGSQKADGPMVFFPDGLKVALTDVYQDSIYMFDLQTRFVRNMGRDSLPYHYAYTLPYPSYFITSDNNLVTWGYDTENIIFKDLSANSEIYLPFEWVSDSSYVEAMALSPDANFLATGHTGAEINIWDLSDQKLVQTLLGHEMMGGDGWVGAIRHLTFNPQNDLLVSIGWDGTTRLWNIHSGLQLQKLNVCCYAEFSPDGRILVTLGEGVLRVWGIPPWP